MKKVSVKKVSVMIGLIAGLVIGVGAAVANIVIDEDFSSDPGWSVKGMSGSPASTFGYNSTQQMIAEAGSSSSPGLFVRHSIWDAYYTQIGTTITDDTDFVIEAKFEVENPDKNGGAVYMGIFNNSSAYADEKNSVYFRATYYNTYSTKAIIRLDDATKIEFGWGSLNPNTWYTGKLVYDASSRTFEYFLNGSSKGTQSLANDQHFACDIFGVSNDYLVSGNINIDGRVDDMYLNAVPEPATIGLIGLGTLGFIRRER